jgi:hypothetical protein
MRSVRLGKVLYQDWFGSGRSGEDGLGSLFKGCEVDVVLDRLDIFPTVAARTSGRQSTGGPHGPHKSGKLLAVCGSDELLGTL